MRTSVRGQGRPAHPCQPGGPASDSTYVLTLMPIRSGVADNGLVPRSAGSWWLWAAALSFAGAVAVLATAGRQTLSDGEVLFTVAVFTPALLTGCLIGWRAAGNLVGACLAWVGAAPACLIAVESWGDTIASSQPWPAAAPIAAVAAGFWSWIWAPLAGLALVFPSGHLPSPRWRAVGWLIVVAPLLVTVVIALDHSTYVAGGGDVPGASPFPVPTPIREMLLVGALAGLLAMLSMAVAAIVVRFRGGDEVVRRQLRWLLAVLATAPILLVAGWILTLLGVDQDAVFGVILAVLVLAVPAAVAIAVLRHELYDVDRLLSRSIGWALTSAVSAGAFSVGVVVLGSFAGLGSQIGMAVATFVTALAVLPLHRVLQARTDRVVDPDRHLALSQVRSFVGAVRDGEAEPEAVEEMLRTALGDPDLRLLLHVPGEDRAVVVNVAGRPDAISDSGMRLPLQDAGAAIGTVVLGSRSARRLALTREVIRAARLPIEVVRLRLQLRGALAETTASRARLANAAAAERRKLERDLHDGAQQRIVAAGMRLRSAQNRLPATHPVNAELDRTVQALEETLAELRRLAHGIRPSRLDDGLLSALRGLAQDCPIPVDLAVEDVEVSDLVGMTAFYVVTESLANALKHAAASRLTVQVTQEGSGIRVLVVDDGVGGAREGRGVRSLRDRVGTVGGRLTLRSTAGQGTAIQADIPCAS